MESPKGRISPLIGSSPYSSPNIALLLRRRILSWTRETKLEPSISVHVGGKIFELHKAPLISKCGYFNKALQNSSEIELPEYFPGGSESFEMVMLFMYDFPLTIDPFNVSALRCVADFLEMTEEYHPLNLVERSDLYLNQVVFQNWDDTLIVLQKCIPLIPVSEELLIVSRCVESLAFMACMEILEPERKTNRPALSMQGLTGRNWNCEIVKEIAGQDLWIKDLIALPFEFFKQIIGSLRRQGMREKYVGPVVMFYANKWVLSKKTHKFWEETSEENGIEDANTKVITILEGIIDLLPLEEKAGTAIPVAFYFALLLRSLSLNIREDSKIKLHEKLVSILHLARHSDFLLPEKRNRSGSVGSSLEVETMERIVKMYVAGKRKIGSKGQTPLRDLSVVADSWDQYITEIASDPSLGIERFVQLIEVIPTVDRETHDHLYEAITTYLLEHSGLSSEQKTSLCNYIECRKLSHETCVHAVQNDQMPLRLIVQALFLQQLHTHQALKDCSDSFRYMQSSELAVTGTLTPNSASPFDGCPPSTSLSNKEYESASFRIQALEKEIISLKKSLQCENSAKVPSFRVMGLDGSNTSKRRKPLGQVKGCVGFGSMTWGSQRCAGRILKLFRRIGLLRKGKGKGMRK
ncbi:BTB/POZ domain-containing protein [Rhynchospora pubera]|uniref:BTB/POZ domain-containing protein n=1 Tax=Rhynchospora pubera TaxID=906938 RepID=A0AAV8D447_9POAL|nr:BTB/POZ domain-containing protein [Rhynchospora pubera]